MSTILKYDRKSFSPCKNTNNNIEYNNSVLL